MQLLGAQAVPIDRLSDRLQQILHAAAMLHLLEVGVDAVVLQAQPDDPYGGDRVQHLGSQEALLPTLGLNDHHVGSGRPHLGKHIGVDRGDPDDLD
ncbi:MAG: hypothetical protein GWN66_23740, partial [Pseudomonas stutzeri]|nr:hypothetical protein [Stutzerimonas stutzeri]